MKNMKTRQLNQHHFWQDIAWIFLFFWILTSTTQLILTLSGATSYEGFKDTTLTTAFWLLPVLLFPQKTKKVTAVLGLLIWLCALPGFAYFLVYKQELSQSLIFIIFESNRAESTEYLKNYFTISILIKLILSAFIPFIIWKKIPSYLNISPKKSYFLALIIFIFIFSYPVIRSIQQNNLQVFYKKINKHFVSAPPWQLILGYANYQRELKEVESFLHTFNQSKPLQGFKEASKPSPTTAVIVIGESSTRLHFGLYGYHRDTNPKLSTIKNELQVFKRVYASRPNTIESLEQVLSFADQLHPDLYKTKPTLIAMMKQAGYKTIWISNQQTLTARNTILTTFARQTDHQVWLNNARSQNSYSFDEKVLEPFSRALEDKAEKKLIIVHLIGTHMSYKYRYPDAYDFFKNGFDLPKDLSEEKIEKINAYDNAIRYNDTIVYELINRLKSLKQHSVLTYFSDHGEDVYDSKGHDFQGRNEAIPTHPMYAIPFIIWTSNNWFRKPIVNDESYLNRQYDNADFIYTFSDLLGIKYQGYNAWESILSKSFVPDAIMVGDPYHPKTLQHLEKTE